MQDCGVGSIPDGWNEVTAEQAKGADPVVDGQDALCLAGLAPKEQALHEAALQTRARPAPDA